VPHHRQQGVRVRARTFESCEALGRDAPHSRHSSRQESKGPERRVHAGERVFDMSVQRVVAIRSLHGMTTHPTLCSTAPSQLPLQSPTASPEQYLRFETIHLHSLSPLCQTLPDHHRHRTWEFQHATSGPFSLWLPTC
jgi:hypothetical protein